LIKYSDNPLRRNAVVDSDRQSLAFMPEFVHHLLELGGGARRFDPDDRFQALLVKAAH
jgi:hypothetical protein